MGNSRTFEQRVSDSNGLKRNVRDDLGRFEPINVGINSKYQKKISDQDAWYAAAQIAGLSGADCFICPKGFAILSPEEQAKKVKAIVMF